MRPNYSAGVFSILERSKIVGKHKTLLAILLTIYA